MTIMIDILYCVLVKHVSCIAIANKHLEPWLLIIMHDDDHGWWPIGYEDRFMIIYDIFMIDYLENYW